MTGQEAPGPWELQRGFDRLGSEMTRGFADMNARLDRLVSTDAFAAEQRRVDEAFATVREDISDLKTSAKESRTEAVNAKRFSIGTLLTLLGLIVAAASAAGRLLG